MNSVLNGRLFLVVSSVCALFFGCASSVATNTDGSVGEAALTDTAPSDAPVSTDSAEAGTTGDRCQTASDCAGRPRPPDEYSSPGTPGSQWSCIANQCTFELGGGRTCEFRPDGCMLCTSGAALFCPGSSCNFSRPPGLSSLTLLSATCMRPDLSMVDQCFGDFVRLRDGTICSLRYAPTGAPITVLACGGCWTSLR